MAVDRQGWSPPDPPTRGEDGDVAGALGGSRLWDQPAQAADRARLDRFVEPGPPLAVEVGFDHGITLLAHARAFVDWRWLGSEIRRRRVAAVQPLAPDNCLPLRVDARVLFATLLPADRVGRVDILFPTPALRGEHLLLTPAFVASLRRCLAPDGVVHLQTDLPALARLASDCFEGWPSAPSPPTTPELSRRARICRRDGVPVHSLSVRRPPDAS